MKKIIVIISIIFIIFLCIKNEKTIMVPDDSIRFRIISNSNNKEDITVKEYLTSKILNNKDLFESNSISESRDKINKNVNNIDALINNTFNELNYNKDYKINYGINYFPEKIYKGIKYNDGYYESLVITIGEGKGDNYFCVMYPPLCLIDDNNDEIEYKFKIIEILKKYIIKK